MPAAILGPIAGAAVGGLMGGDSSTSQTASKEPWKAAQPWLQSNLDSGQALQGYYQQNPFNQLQQTGYQNQLSNLDNFQQNTAPGLMAFANKLMGSNYQRSPQSNQGAAWMNQGGQQGQGQPMQSQQGMAQGMQQMQGAQGSQGGGLLQAMNSIQKNAPAGLDGNMSLAGLLGPGGSMSSNGGMGGGGMGGQQAGPFSVAPSQQYGTIDWAAMNPYNGVLKPASQPAANQQAIDAAVAAEIERQRKAQENASGSQYA